MTRRQFRALRAGARRFVAWAMVIGFLVPLLPSAGRAAEAPAPATAAAPAPTPAADLPQWIPATATFLVGVDLREESPSLRVLNSLMREQDRAIVGAVIEAAGQAALSELTKGLDLEDDILPWVGRRAYLVGLSRLSDRRPGLLLLVETRDPERAEKTLGEVLRRTAPSGSGPDRRMVNGAAIYRLNPGDAANAVSLTVAHGILAISTDGAVLSRWVQQSAAEPPANRWRGTMRALPQGLLTMGIGPGALQGETENQVINLGLAGAAASLGLTRAGSSAQVAVDTVAPPASQIVQQLAAQRLTGEALDAIPANALAAASVVPTAGVLKAFGMDQVVVSGLSGLLAGPQGEKLAPRLAAVVRNLLGGEIAAGLLAVRPQVRWLGAVVQADEASVNETLGALREALPGVKGLQVAEETVGGAAGLKVVIPARVLGMRAAGDQPVTVHLVAAGKRLLVASDPEGVQAGMDAAREPGTASVRATPSYRAVSAQLPRNSALQVFADTRALAREVSALGVQEMGPSADIPFSPKYVLRLVDAMLLPYTGTGISLSVQGSVATATFFQGADWSKASVAAAGMPGILAVGAAVALPVFSRARDNARKVSCQNNMKQLALAAMMYAQDYDEHLMPADNWRKVIDPYLKNNVVFHCPSDGQEHPNSYGMNRRLSRKTLAQIPDATNTILFFESAGKSESPADTGQSLASPPRHLGGNNFAFVDGHVKWVQRVVAPLTWGPAPKAAPKPKPGAKTPAKRPVRKPVRR